MKRPTELIEKAKGFKSTDPIRVLAEYAVSLESPRKTVKDAVDCFDGVWPKHAQDCEYMSWTGFNFAVTRVRVGNHVCTREEFKAEVERRKGWEWTHKSEGGMFCKVMYEDNETQLVYFADGSKSCYWDAKHFAVKRKPTISKAEAWDMLVGEDLWPTYIVSEYDVK